MAIDVTEPSNSSLIPPMNLTSFPVATSQIRKLSLLEDMTNIPSGLKAKEPAAWKNMSMTLINLPVDVSHSRRVLSSPPETKYFPVGLKATEFTAAL